MHEDQAPWTTYEDPDLLLSGLSHSGVTIRYPRDNERQRVQELTRLAVDQAADVRHVRDVFNGGSLVRAFADPNPARAARVRGTLSQPSDLIHAGTIILVAEAHGQIQGVAVAGISTSLLRHVLSETPTGISPREALLTLSSITWSRIAKLLYLAVDPAHQSNGIGGALLAATTQLFRLANYGVLYGQCEPHLGSFYENNGFDITPEGSAVDISKEVGMTQLLHTPDGNLIFTKRLGQMSPDLMHSRTPWLAHMIATGDEAVPDQLSWVPVRLPNGAPMLYVTPPLYGMESRGFKRPSGRGQGLQHTLTTLRIQGADVHLCTTETERSTTDSSLQVFDDLALNRNLIQSINEFGSLAIIFTDKLPTTREPDVTDHVRLAGISVLHRTNTSPGSSFYRS